MRARITFATVGLCIWGAAVTYALAQSPEEGCAACHDQGQKLATSAHATLGCTSCHSKHGEYPHPTGLPKPGCAQCHASVAGEQARSAHAQALKEGSTAAPTCPVCHGDAHELKSAVSAEFRKSVPEICGTCHTETAQQFQNSVHGRAVAKGIPAAPICTSCHGEHSILPPTSKASLVHHTHVPETCGQCHGNVRLSRRFGLPEDRILSFDESFHGLAAKAGSQSVANCASCHGIHEILPSSDPKAKTNAKNLPATCGHCHPGAGRRFALGPIHQVNGRDGTSPVQWARVFYQIVIPLAVGFMLLHNLGDWLRKLSQRRLRRRPAEATPEATEAPSSRPAMRILSFERLQHAVLAVSFIVLVWTGFALKYPDHWWARPLVMWESAWPVRGTVHRIASVVLIVTAVMHVASLIASRRLRQHWKLLWPRRADLAEGAANFGYNMGVRLRRPILSDHSYVEKVEYWAVVWGTVIMILTGVMLWADNLMLQWLPKTVIDLATTVHFYEAVLAAAAIVAWHFYTVIFDPEVYPMDTAWLTGFSVRKRPAESEPAEPQEVSQEDRAEPEEAAPEVEEHDSVT